jgi:hypothetical protein
MRTTALCQEQRNKTILLPRPYRERRKSCVFRVFFVLTVAFYSILGTPVLLLEAIPLQAVIAGDHSDTANIIVEGE